MEMTFEEEDNVNKSNVINYFLLEIPLSHIASIELILWLYKFV